MLPGLTAWHWSVMVFGSSIALVLTAGIGAVDAFHGGALMSLNAGGSFAFVGLLSLIVVIVIVSTIASAIKRLQEVKAGYTTIPNAYQEVAWRDHATGEILKQPDDPFPPGTMKQVRSAVREKRDREGET